MSEKKIEQEKSSPKNEKDNSPGSIIKLLKKINQLLNEINYLKAKNKELEKIYNESNSFLRDIPAKNPLQKKAHDLLNESQSRLEKLEARFKPEK